VRDAEYRGEREALHGGIQKAFAEYEDGALVVGWFLVTEVRAPDGSSYLSYRSGDINQQGLKSWQGLGYLHSAVNAVEDQSRESYMLEEDDDGDES
jgi:hypothetical protein